MLHGFPEAAFAWDDILLGLAPRVASLAPNLRGYSGSSAPADLEAYQPRMLVADVASLIEALGAPIDLLVAHDWGGALAWSLAARRPELLRRLLIVNSPHPAAFLRELRDNPAQRAASAYMNFLCRPDAEILLTERDHARLWPFFGEAAWLTPSLRDQYRANWQRGLTGPLNYYRASPLRPAAGPQDALHSLELPAAAVTVRVRQREIPAAVLGSDPVRDKAYRQRIGQWVDTQWRDKDALIDALLPGGGAARP